MDDGMYSEFMSYLATPGKISESVWRDAYRVRTMFELGHRELALCNMISVISRIARSRRERLPDYLHNMMILNSGGVKPQEETDVCGWQEWSITDCGWQEWSKKQVLSYVKMLGRV